MSEINSCFDTIDLGIATAKAPEAEALSVLPINEHGLALCVNNVRDKTHHGI